MERHQFQVDGMECAGCARIVRRNLAYMDGVEDVEADAATDTVACTAAPERLPAVRAAVADLGYDPRT